MGTWTLGAKGERGWVLEAGFLGGEGGSKVSGHKMIFLLMYLYILSEILAEDDRFGPPSLQVSRIWHIDILYVIMCHIARPLGV